MEVWVATSNQGKLNEFRSLLEPLGFSVHSPKNLSVYSFPQETGKTFEENARIKARSLRSVKKDVWVVGEDSGLEVEGLGGLPGIHSARYAGPKASDAENNAKLLKMLSIRSPSQRQAAFQCTLVVYDPRGAELVLKGELKGQIAQAEKGSTGFGYDSVFIPEGQEKTLAELGLAFKNKISHRAQAIRLLEAKLRESHL